MQHSKGYHARVKKRILRRRLIFVSVALVLTLAAVFGIWKLRPNESRDGSVNESQHFPSTPAEPFIVSTATIGSTGDILIHSPILSNAKTSSGEYDFNNMFPHITSYFENYDLMVANLEVTLGGTKAGAYSGYPVFNSPDSLIDAIINSGTDMLLTANNHSYDTGFDGLLRTVQVLDDKNIQYLGTRSGTDRPLYMVEDINGIKIGMACFTYSTTHGSRKALNGMLMKEEAGPLVATFDYNRLDEFYAEATEVITDMKNSGADKTIFYIHWGNEYQRTPNTYQKNIAQKLCDIGVDVIIGGHPHVIQPFETLTNADGHETVCIYSMGNAVSNQRKEIMDSDNYSGHTEDGMIFSVKFQKWSDGRVELCDVNILPTWVNLKTSVGRRVYQIIPLDTSIEDWSTFEVKSVSNAVNSYNRTMKLVGEGLNGWRKSRGLNEVLTKIE